MNQWTRGRVGTDGCRCAASLSCGSRGDMGVHKAAGQEPEAGVGGHYRPWWGAADRARGEIGSGFHLFIVSEDRLWSRSAVRWTARRLRRGLRLSAEGGSTPRIGTLGGMAAGWSTQASGDDRLEGGPVDRTTAAEVIARLHQAQTKHYGVGAEAGVREVLTPDVSWHVPGDNAIAGDYHGIEPVLAYFRRRRDLADSTFTMMLRDVLVGQSDHAAALTDGTATINGERHTWSTVGLYRIFGGRIAACWLLPLDPFAFDAIWSRGPIRTPRATTTFRTTARPRHCDAQGALHASRYYEYFEDAFLHWLDTNMGGYSALRATGTDLVVVASGCDHHQGARLGDELEIEVRPEAAGRTSLSMVFAVRGDAGEALATGRTTYVAVSADQGTVPLPAALQALTEDLP